MFLFRDQEVVEIPISCKICLKEIKFSVSVDEYKSTSSFPIKKEDVHGTPKHRLIVYINKHLDIENFKLEDNIDKEESETAPYDEEVTRQVLRNIDLNDEQIDLYLKITGRDAVSLGEMAILMNKPKDTIKQMCDYFVSKGLFNEIVGATPHYSALPPYAALVSQLKDFHTYITDLKKNAPVELNKSFSQLESKADGIKDIKQYTDFMLDLKQNTLSQMLSQKKEFDKTSSVIDEIAGLQDFITGLEKDAKNIMDSQVSELTNQFGDISAKISQSMDHQVQDLSNQFENINSQITGIVRQQIEEFKNHFVTMKQRVSQNLQKLRLGVLQQAVDQVIEMSFSEWLNKITQNLNNQLSSIEKISKDGLVKTKIGLNRQIKEIQDVQNKGLRDTTEKFNKQLISKLKSSIDSTVDNIKGITANTAQSGDVIKKLFGDISKNFSKAVTMAEEKLGGMSDSVFGSFSNLRETFSTKIIDALNEILGHILERLELSERATRQFWQQAISGGGGDAALTMNDIWFIRSIEGAKAHVNDEVSKAKMRVLIVAPTITDLNLNSIKSAKKHVNIRIATNIDLSNAQHVSVLNELNELHNISIRSRKLQNIWGINRDYEEVILCVISKTEIGGQTKTEIAGIGSIIQEHIKIFVPILEDAWMGSQKGGLAPMVSATALKPATASKPKKQPKPAPIQTAPKQTLKPKPRPALQPTPRQTLKPTPRQTLKPTPISDKPKLKVALTPISDKPKLKVALTPVSINKKPVEGGSLKAQFDTVLSKLNNGTGDSIASELAVIKNNIESERGYSGVLNPINLTISQLKFDKNPINQTTKNELEKKINFWRKKLNV